MRVIYLYFLLALIPTETLLSNNTILNNSLNGIWIDHYSDVVLEIKNHRKGLKIRQIKRFKKSKWRTYYKLGYGTFDDCDGRSLIILNRNRLKWNKGRYKEFILKRKRFSPPHYNESYNNRRHERNTNNYRRNYDLNYDFEGQWYCAKERLYLDIEYFKDGFRARRPNREWIYYDQDRYGDYRDRNGNRYYLQNSTLYWESKNGRKSLRFSKR